MNPDHILAAPTHPDPYPFYARLVEGPPLVYDARHKLWIASSAAGVKAVLAHPDCHVRPAAEPVPQAIVGSAAGEVFGHLVRMNEGVRHHAPKLALQRFLAALDLGHVQQRTESIAAQTMAQAGSVGGAGLSRWTLDVPVMTVADLLGFEASGLGQVAGWMGDFVACLSPLSNAAQLEAAGKAAQALLARFSGLAGAAAAQPRSALAQVQLEAVQAGWIDTHALLANLVGLLSQTYEATAGLIGNSIVALATQSGLRQAVGLEPDRILALVQEVSRHDPSIHSTRRFVARPVEVAGEHLPAGEVILLVLAAAGRDPLCNPQPHAFLLDRPEREVPGFGHGRHQCPGQALACAIAASALKALLAGDGLQALPRSWHYRPSMNARIPVFAD